METPPEPRFSIGAAPQPAGGTACQFGDTPLVFGFRGDAGTLSGENRVRGHGFALAVNFVFTRIVNHSSIAWGNFALVPNWTEPTLRIAR
jgi:hypothetical protein